MNNPESAPNSKPDPIRTGLILLGVILTLLGQIWLYTTPIDDAISLPWPVWVSLGGAVIFISAYGYRPVPVLHRLAARLPANPLYLGVLFSISLSILAALASYLFEKYVLNNFIPVVSIWFLGAFCYLSIFLPREWPQFTWSAWFREHRQELAWLGPVLILGLICRFYALGAYPRVINGDEGRIGLVALGTSQGALLNPFALWENIGALYLQFINVFFAWLGPSPFSLRLLPAIGGSLAILTTYLFARQVTNRRVALVTATLLAFSHIHIHFSRTVAVSYIQGTWLIPLELYLMLSGLQKRSSWRAALGGIILAIHMSVYISAQITVGIVLVYTLLAALWLKNDFRPAWRQALAFWGGFVITFIPEAFYMIKQPTEFLNRINENGTFDSGWMANEIALTGKSTAQILLERVFHAFLSLIYYPAVDFYGSPVPVLSFIVAVLFILGLGYILVRVRSLPYLLLNGYFWGVTMAVALFAIPPAADSYRMLIALPAALLIAAIALDQILTKVGLGWEHQRFKYSAITTMILATLLAFNIWVYFFDFIGKCRYGGDTQTRFASYLGNYVHNIDSESDVYLLSDDIYRYGSHASVDFLTQKRPIANLPESLANYTFSSGETIIASPKRIEELHQWARDHPGGQLHYQYDCQKPILLGYQVP